MLKQGTAPREFTDAQQLRAHYAELHRRTWAIESPRRVEQQPKPEPVVTAPILEAIDLREQLDAVRVAAEAAEREATRARILEVLDPEKLAREPRKIIRRVAEENGLTYEQVVGRDRTASVLAVRRQAIAAVRAEHPTLSLPQLGRHFGRDHTTILHALLRTDGYSAGEIVRLRREGGLPSKASGNNGGRPRKTAP